ncbi:MAG: acetyl-CoA carboxylase biotin carboxyl carrier protein [Zymomonas mobilis subsp. pomaceae]|uniref:Biotin carboxyl carrier protein of acetyl-CoA carboxylase n=1 Tax=Zymomonas mobilis subsp. pomaceae (strain ATCC 29192 / DSM 22645 / JCM 10191 / CCUG 17912 / NBRC 13757 / NCIMB 11200 / NRRL B-4491 / Barker I) TaxID=579138 RepID=F8EVT1_ZYMMT|nr:acetyl-CoA carboxylase biotin carboxyl carrier protein [Zymomonas mobilis]AEI37408.1 acetyl-CoA carboxylase, biotin carboxyl carrier protein [Zymomonas mobilis subsp. pomaceae ATCC 29192]MDX5948776.1 acetyl-CoA carboxylase biotin carboxyl carrier protein [Zymomonas mobilis subsp. pomaceae]GEB88583.1 acetyl-CoA carboxylase, biotin carboxyl carrier protein [Zymomonas mobilis subsp. pomaceae]
MTEKHKEAMQVDPELVNQLAKLLDETNLTEIEVQDGDRRIRVVRNATVYAAPTTMAVPTAAMPAPAAPPAAPAGVPLADHPGTVHSPMVGTVYLAPEPEASNFIHVGDKVEKGATLLIVEAMKVMNPIVAPKSGVVTSIMVENAQPVEFDQPLVVIE